MPTGTSCSAARWAVCTSGTTPPIFTTPSNSSDLIGPDKLEAERADARSASSIPGSVDQGKQIRQLGLASVEYGAERRVHAGPVEGVQPVDVPAQAEAIIGRILDQGDAPKRQRVPDTNSEKLGALVWLPDVCPGDGLKGTVAQVMVHV